jgi:glycerol kinase
VHASPGWQRTAVRDSAGVTVLPALAGLGAPWWLAGAHGVIAGLHASASAGHVARAALEAIAWRVADIVEAMATAVPVASVRADGGLSNDETLLRIQADALTVPLEVGSADVTVRGAAMLAGVGAGVYASVEDAAQLLPRGRVIAAGVEAEARHRSREGWREFVERAARL